MANLLALTKAYPSLVLEPGDVLIEAGEARGELFILASAASRSSATASRSPASPNRAPSWGK